MQCSSAGLANHRVVNDANTPPDKVNLASAGEVFNILDYPAIPACLCAHFLRSLSCSVHLYSATPDNPLKTPH